MSAAPDSYVDKDLDITQNGVRRERSASGLGDIRLFGRYTLHRRDWPGRTLRIAPFAGIETPTGDDDERHALGRLPAGIQPGSGSWDPFGGVVLTYQTLDFQIDAQVSYRANTEANDFEFGDVARLDGSLQYRLWPRKLGSGVPGFLYGILETNLIYQDENRIGGIDDPDSGGFTMFILPGLQYVTRRWITEAGVQVPVVQVPGQGRFHVIQMSGQYRFDPFSADGRGAELTPPTISLRRAAGPARRSRPTWAAG